MTETPTERPVHVVIVGDYLPFPNGMAISSRARLIARALRESGATVQVIILQATGPPASSENTIVRGDYEGVPFEYACGTTRRHDSFIVRRIVSAWGWLHGAMRLLELRQASQADAVLLWFWTPRPVARLAFYVILLRLLRIPVICEIDESTWSMKAHRSLLERLWSPLAGMDGAVTISGELQRWATKERHERQPWRVIEVPILVDVHEQRPNDYPRGEPLVVFAGSAAYRTTVRFILEAMKEVWRTQPGCRIAITGISKSDPRAWWLHEELLDAGYDGRIDLLGYLSRQELLGLYERAHALLIPLFDDVQSRSRFPTKIGEYLAASRPIVTNAVGEVSRYFTDGVDAVVCPPGRADAFGSGISRLLSDPDRAALIGRRGRALAEAQFHYSLYGQTLVQMFADVAGRELPR